MHTATLPGVRALRPWVTCRQALGHLSGKDLGTPVRLRWRGCQGHQVASVPDRPARVVGTSNLSDGNVLAHPTEAMRDRRQHRHPGRKPRASHADEPAHVITCRDASGDGATLFAGPNHRPSKADAPARTLTRNTHGDGALIASADMFAPSVADEPSKTVRVAARGTQTLLVNGKHPVNTPDAPSFTVTSKGDGRGAVGACVLALDGDGHPASRIDEPALTVPASQPGNGGAVLAWPWDRASTTVTTRGAIPPPGHHPESSLSLPGAVKLSEKAAAILQGFPDKWVFSGATKRARWAQIGMAMPPPLAEAVGRSIRVALFGRSEAAQ